VVTAAARRRELALEIIVRCDIDRTLEAAGRGPTYVDHLHADMLNVDWRAANRASEREAR
jgi:hypothetical protein